VLPSQDTLLLPRVSPACSIKNKILTLAVVIISNKYSLWFANGISVVKLLTLVFISITGFVVLAGRISAVPDPGFNFRDSFSGTTSDAYGITNALVRINFAYAGWENCFNVVAEIKVSHFQFVILDKANCAEETYQDCEMGWSSFACYYRRSLHVR